MLFAIIYFRISISQSQYLVFLLQARQVAEIINSGIQPIQNLSIIKTVALYTGKEEDKAKWANHFIRKGFIGKFLFSFALD